MKELENILSGCLFQYVFFLNNKWIALSVLYLEKFYVYMLVLSTRLFLSWHNEFKLEENCQKREVSQRHMLLLYYGSVI